MTELSGQAIRSFHPAENPIPELWNQIGLENLMYLCQSSNLLTQQYASKTLSRIVSSRPVAAELVHSEELWNQIMAMANHSNAKVKTHAIQTIANFAINGMINQGIQCQICLLLLSHTL